MLKTVFNLSDILIGGVIGPKRLDAGQDVDAGTRIQDGDVGVHLKLTLLRRLVNPPCRQRLQKGNMRCID